jgi:hypothetical protein
LEPLEKSIEEALQRTFGSNTEDYFRYQKASDFYTGSTFIGRETHPSEVHAAVRDSKNGAWHF